MIQKELLKLYRKSTAVGKHLALLRQKLYLSDIPHACVLCDTPTPQRICSLCETQFFTQPQHRCSCCALPLAHNALLCGECLTRMPIFETTLGTYLYEKPLSTLIFAFKENRDFYAGKALADLMTRNVKTHYQNNHLPLPNLIVPVPLHWKKQWRRGFNQSLFLGNHLSTQLHIPLFTQAKRNRAATPQKLSGRQQRLNNMNHCFSVASSLLGKDVAIVDDVMTTGATANTFAKALRDAGARRVSVWVLARTPKNLTI